MGVINNVVYLDLETTGLSNYKDEIIEIGAVKVCGGEAVEYHALINPSIYRIPQFILNLCTGLKEDDLRKAPSFKDIKDEFLAFIEDYPLICHNAAFEKSFLEKALGAKMKNIFLDSLQLCCIFKPHFPRHNLDYLLQHYLQEGRREEHRALQDARDTRNVVEKLFIELGGAERELLDNTMGLMEGTGWPWLPYLRAVPFGLTYATAAPPPQTGKEEPFSPFSLGDIEELLRKEDLWQEHFPGYRFKPHQLEMALSVADSFEQEQALFIEAPTGSGKTLAYLLVALLWSAREKEKVFISTNTKNLQQQVQSDLPRIARALGIEGMSFADMKGINNYACKNRIGEEAQAAGKEEEDCLARAYLSNWMLRTATGEIEDLSYWLKANNRFLPNLGNLVRCRKEDCLENECRYHSGCFYRKKVRAMRNSSICTINHSLLLTWPGHYPEMQKVIIDEAHALEEKAFDAFAGEVSSRETATLCHRLLHGQDKGYLNYLLFYRKKTLPSADFSRAFKLVEKVRIKIDEISEQIDILRRESGVEAEQSYSREITEEWAELKDKAFDLALILEDLSFFLEGSLQEIIRDDADFENMSLFRQGEEYFRLCRSWSTLLQNCFASENEKVCRSLEYKGGHWSFRITPLDISTIFYNKVLEKTDSIVLTSATLAEKGHYDKVSSALGFNYLEPGKTIYAEPLKPAYDYYNNSVLALPSDSPEYRSPAFTEYMATAVLKAALMLGGRTMVLFTSLARMEEVMEKVSQPLEQAGIMVYGGRYASKQNLLNYFKEDNNAVLFGSRGFYEGVDVKGPALSCVIIDKLSYPYLGDPVHQARSRYLDSRGQNSFMELSLSEAVRTLRQQFGRLLRSEHDRGFVLVMDQLKRGSRYYEYILGELPGPQVIADKTLEEIFSEMRERFLDWGYTVY